MAAARALWQAAKAGPERLLRQLTPRVVRENLVSAWCGSSLQRLESGIPADVCLTAVAVAEEDNGEKETAPAGDGERRFRVAFSDGVEGVFVMPRGTEAVAAAAAAAGAGGGGGGDSGGGDGDGGGGWLQTDEPLPSSAPSGGAALVDIERQPQRLWGPPGTATAAGDGGGDGGGGGEGGTASAADVAGMLQRRGGALRFAFDELVGGNDGDSTRSGADASGAVRTDEQLGVGRARLPRAVARRRAELIEALQRYGIAVVHGAPQEPGVGVGLCDALFGAVQSTIFGYSFTIKQVDDPHNLAYANIALQHHTDLPYCKAPPDLEMFHCIRRADRGGDSLFNDGFALAEELRRRDPAAFALLAATPVLHQDLTDRWDLRAAQLTINCGDPAAGGAGRPCRPRDKPAAPIERIVFNERTRDSWRQAAAVLQAAAATADGRADGTQAEAEAAALSPDFFAALAQFEALVDDPRWHVTVPLQPGEVAIFDNARVLHSRNEFQGHRHMEGCYLSWENAHATWRALQWQVRGRPYSYCGHDVGGAGSA